MEEIKMFLVDRIRRYTGISIDNFEKNIFEYNVQPLDMLYVIRDMEQVYSILSSEVFSNSKYTIMSINNLSARIDQCIVDNKCII